MCLNAFATRATCKPAGLYPADQTTAIVHMQQVGYDSTSYVSDLSTRLMSLTRQFNADHVAIAKQEAMSMSKEHEHEHLKNSHAKHAQKSGT